MRPVKILLSLPALFAVAWSLCGCNTLANRRTLYWPKKGEGYWTTTLHDGSWKKRGAKPADETIVKGGRPDRTPASIPPPPPPPSAPLPEPAGVAVPSL
jgi:hypothetical protein